MGRPVSAFKKAPEAPRRFKSAYMFFSTAKHKEIRCCLEARDEKWTTPQVAKMVAKVWKTLPRKERAHWDSLADRDRARFTIEMVGYRGPLKVARHAKAPRDPLRPKRPMSAFLFYCNEQRPLVRRDHPTLSTTEISPILAKQWRELTGAAKQRFFGREADLRGAYKVKLAEYQRAKETGRLVREHVAVLTAARAGLCQEQVPSSAAALLEAVTLMHAQISKPAAAAAAPSKQRNDPSFWNGGSPSADEPTTAEGARIAVVGDGGHGPAALSQRGEECNPLLDGEWDPLPFDVGPPPPPPPPRPTPTFPDAAAIASDAPSREDAAAHAARPTQRPPPQGPAAVAAVKLHSHSAVEEEEDVQEEVETAPETTAARPHLFFLTPASVWNRATHCIGRIDAAAAPSADPKAYDYWTHCLSPPPPAYSNCGGGGPAAYAASATAARTSNDTAADATGNDPGRHSAPPPPPPPRQDEDGDDAFRSPRCEAWPRVQASAGANDARAAAAYPPHSPLDRWC